MSSIELKYLLNKYFDNCITVEELRILEEVLEQSSQENIEAVLLLLLTQKDMEVELSNAQITESLSHVLDNLKVDLVSSMETKPTRFRKKFIHVFGGVAAILLGVLGILFFSTDGHENVERAQIHEELYTAKSLAKITLVNGDSIEINTTTTGIIYNKGGIQVFKTERGEIIFKGEGAYLENTDYLTISTPKGGFIKMKLSDGTEVSLNANSNLKYPMHFNATVRKVYAEGELFFDVAKDTSRPFVIHSDKQIIEVLGTSFNLYTNKNIAKTTLIDGIVKIIVKEKGYTLKPGEQAIVSNSVKIIDVKVDNEIDWTNGYFIFDNTSFVDLLNEIEDWYNVKFVFETDEIIDIELFGTVSRQVKLSELLKVLELNTKYKFQIRERRVVVK